MSRIASVIFFLTAVLASTTALAQLATPTITQVKVESGDLAVAASPLVGATSYEAQASWTTTAKLNELRTAVAQSADRITFRSSDLPTNTAVTLTVVGVDPQGRRSPTSKPVSTYTALAAPSGVSGTPGYLRISISWKAVTGAASYRLTLSNGMSFITTSPSYVVTGLPTATKFNCLVWAMRANGETSVASAPVVVQTANVALLD